jgi:methionyl-tRNA formyltransferase
MTPTSKTIVFFGTDSFSAASLRALIAARYTIAAVVTKPDSTKGRGRKLSKSIVKEIAEQHSIPVWQPHSLREIEPNIDELIQKHGTAPTGVLVSYGKIIPESIITMFEPGIINVHPSLLPRYRGPSPIETAILNGDPETGVTIMQLSKAMDAGPIYTQLVVPLAGTETTPELEATLAQKGAAELVQALPGIIDGGLQPTAQNDDLASYCQLLDKKESILDTSTLTAAEAERHIRAYLAYPKTKATVAGHPIVITGAHVSTTASSPLDLACSDGHYLSIDHLIGPSGKPMTATAFINGYIK